MKDLKFENTIQFGIWKFLDNVDGFVRPRFACAQPIPVGVRIGEDYATFEDVGVCGTNLPSISCAGATNSVTLYDARLIEPDENTITASRQMMYINGVSTDILPDFLESIPVPPPVFPPPEGYEWTYSEILRNTSTEDVRLEFAYEPTNQNMKRTILTGNLTIIEFNNNRSGVCLSRYLEDLQSCNFGWITIENMLAWSSVSAYESQLQTWFKLENVETNETIAFKECNGTNEGALIAAAFEEFLLQINASMKLSAELMPDAWAGVNRFNLVNTSTNNLQLRYSATIGNEGDLNVVDGEGVVSEEFNPTQFDRYKEVRFCLAPQPIQVGNYPPYAALRTTAAWGTTIPALIVVNGTEYTGSLVNELAPILQQQYHVMTLFDQIDPAYSGGPNAVRIGFEGTGITENLSIYIEFLSEIDVIVDDSGLYPPNETLIVTDGFKAQFNLGKNDIN